MTTDQKSPQTFEEWWDESIGEGPDPDRDPNPRWDHGELRSQCSDAFAAGVASQQAESGNVRQVWAETDTAHRQFEARLKAQLAEKDREIERLKQQNEIASDLIHEHEAVVDAAREVAIHHAAGVLSGSLNASLATPMKKLRAALAALESDGK